MKDIIINNTTNDTFSEVLYCKQIMVGNRLLLGLDKPDSEELNALLRDIYEMANLLKEEYGIRLTLEDACISRPPLIERRSCRKSNKHCGHADCAERDD